MKFKSISLPFTKCVAAASLLLASLSAQAATQIASQLPLSAATTNVGGGNSYDPIVTPGGRYVLFASTSDNLVTGTGGLPLPEAVPAHLHVYLRDRQVGATVLVSVNIAGTCGGNGDSFPCAISSNGQFAFFQSAASDLVAGDTNGATDVFMRDIVNNTTTLVSVGTDGSIGNGASREASITPDGRYVAFVSAATNLVAGDSNGIPDVFVRDLQLGVTTLASPGAQKVSVQTATSLTGGSSSESPVISADGRYVAFYSTAIGLVPNVASSGEIYVRDLMQQTTAWVSTNAHKINSSAVSANYAMSTNGQFIAYQTAGVTPIGMVFRFNVVTGATDDIATNGAVVTSLDTESRKVDISADGRFVAFTLTNKPGGVSIQLWDGQSNVTSLISGAGTNAALCDFPRVDQSGRYVAFTSDDALLTTNSDGAFHVYVRDTSDGSIQLVDAFVSPISSIMTPFHLSADGGVVAFDCPDGALSSNPNKFDAFLRDFNSNTIEVISTPVPILPITTPLNISELTASAVSSNGQYVAFMSYSDGIASGDTNRCPDVYLHNFATGSNTLVSVSFSSVPSAPQSGNNSSAEPSISADGRYVAFSSYSTNILLNDTNNSEDIFLRDMQTMGCVLVSTDLSGAGEGNGNSFSPQLSADGEKVLFYSRANDLVPSKGTVFGIQPAKIYWRDIQAGVTYLIATNLADMTPDGSNILYGAGNQIALWNAQSHSATIVATLSSPIVDAVISPDAQRAAFKINGSSTQTIYAADLIGNSNWVLATSAYTSQKSFQFSGDSRFLAYLATDYTGTNQVYLYDFQNATNTLVSQSYNSTGGGNGASDSLVINADGSLVAFRSAASNLVPGDNNGVPDIFLYSPLTGGTTLISVSQFGPWSANGRSLTPVFSGDGQTLFFESWASDLAPGDFNDSSDIFAVSLSMSSAIATTNAPPPLNPGIVVGTTGGQISTNQPLSVTWASVTGTAYQVQFKDDLNNPQWQLLNGTATVVGSQGSIIDLTPSTAQRFYRIVSY